MKVPGLIALGPAIGLAFGFAIGQSVEEKYKKEGKIRPLTDREKKRRSILIVSLIVIAVSGLAILLIGLLQ
jgi:hypothetical protein